MRRAIAAAAALAAVPAVAVATADGATRPRPRPAVPVSITAAPGQVDAVQKALGGSALRVVRRNGRDLQVVAARARIPALRALPGVAAAFEAPASFADADPEDPNADVPGGTKAGTILSEGIERVGADALQGLADGGAGVTIAVLDLGFGGTHLPAAQQAGELPPAARTQTQSFDAAYGLAGRNAYGNLTNHGELVAQTVYDYAPKANYVFVNYHSEQDFQAAVDWLIQRHPDIVVHSNSFLEGPFDGTGPAAQAVDRAAASGIAWVNSAGNYAEKHWQGAWADANHDEVLDWTAPGWTFDMGANSPITFALSWDQDPGVEVTDIDLVLEHLEGSAWVEVAASRDNQVAGARPAERFVNYLSPTGGTFRLRAVLASGPPPGGELTLFSREVTLEALGDPAPSSIPTPGDAEGAIAVGAVDWRQDAYKAYSSRGPTDDGRLKPDIVAPTGTRVSTATGPKSVGGTSNAAPNAAGALALLIASRRNAGTPLDPGSAKAALVGDALDLGDVGPDPQFGAGRVRVDVDAPSIVVDPATRLATRARFATLPLRVQATATDASRIQRWAVLVDGHQAVGRAGETAPAATLGARRLPDGRHIIDVRVTDIVGNVGTTSMTVQVDTHRPRVTGLRVDRPAAGQADAMATPAGTRLLADVRDYGTVRLTASIEGDAMPVTRSVRVQATGQVVVPMGHIAPGHYLATLTATDRAGHVTTRTRQVTVTG